MSGASYRSHWTWLLVRGLSFVLNCHFFSVNEESSKAFLGVFTLRGLQAFTGLCASLVPESPGSILRCYLTYTKLHPIFTRETWTALDSHLIIIWFKKKRWLKAEFSHYVEQKKTPEWSEWAAECWQHAGENLCFIIISECYS